MLMLCVMSTFAQKNYDKKYVELNPAWTAGDQHSYSVEKHSTMKRRNGSGSNSSVRCNIDVSVVSVSDDAFVLDCRYRDYTYETTDTAVGRFFCAMETLLNDCTVRVRLDEGGAFDKILNYGKVKRSMLKALKNVSADMQSISKADMDKLTKRAKKNIKNREFVESESIEEISLLTYFNGGAYLRYDTIKVNVDVPNYRGGNPFTAQQKYYVESVDAENGSINMCSYRAVDSKQLKESMFLLLLKHGSDVKREDMPEAENVLINTSKINSDGWTMEVLSDNKVSFGKYMRKSVCSIKMDK